MNSERLSDAIARWQAQIGESYILTDSQSLDRYAQGTEPQSRRALAVLLPQSVEEIQAILQTATDFSIPLYPISKGKNWGYGSTSPASEGCVLVDLSRMNRILELNQELAYAVVEPGVSQGDLYNYLQENNIPLCMDVTGAPPEASLLGNVLERGYGQTPYSDHFLHSCGMEVVLADGRILKTGFGHFAGAKTTYLYKWGVGPYLEGIFTQSNFGIVTKIGIWLMPKPERFGVFVLRLKDDAQLAEAAERFRSLKMRGVLTSAVHLFNDIRILSSLRQYPWDQAQGEVPLPEEVKRSLLKPWGISAWNCGGGLRGSRDEIRLALREIRKVFRGVVPVRYLSEGMIRTASRFQGIYRRLTGVDFSQQLSFFQLMKGVPLEAPTLLAYWRRKKAAPRGNYDPPRDRCGLVWCAPVVPLTQRDVLEFVRITRDVCGRHAFETNLSMSLITARAISCVIGVLYDKEIPEQTRKAAECSQALLEAHRKAGYIPYRFGSQPLPAFFQEGDAYWRVCRAIKEALDPHHILSPGRSGIH